MQEGLAAENYFSLLLLVQHDSALGLLGCFISFLLACCHRLVAPLIGGFHIVGSCLGVFAGDIGGLAAIKKVHVRHGIVIILALVDGRLEHLHALFDVLAVFCLQL